ncbi:phage tail sheath C-terminal domain-containing protein [uncultured Maribacter sp.]|uniref:phage tail sheath family protein n=1 Tax=uncultured Maribacter sp. TaxID=431308 RepID=UPI0030D96038|tara:strand:- start:4213 stop:5763 length:1551 start_codon:yes stop_codon:yes gene_type:complete
MASTYKTPGVYIEEKDAFPGSVVEVATAIPAFIGYTEKASRNGKSLANTPVRITSLMEYEEFFGGGNTPKFSLDSDITENGNSVKIDDQEIGIRYVLNTKLFFFNSIRLFYANGGGTCYIVSVGTFGEDGEVVLKKVDFESGLKTLEKEQEPTMVLVPDAVNLSMESCYALYQLTIAHCAKMQNRVAILDVYDGYKDRKEEDVIELFRAHIGTENLSYAAAYYPWLETNIVQNGELTFKNLDASVDLNSVFPEAVAKQILADFRKDDKGFKKVFEVENPDLEEDKVQALLPEYIKNKEHDFHLGLVATSPTYVSILNEIKSVVNLIPPAAAMAGIYTAVDNNRGVWKSPANVSINSVIKPAVNITHDEQESLNVDALSGKSINAIRTFPGVGTMVWGGRTLDGNSLDWRYINVRRTMIMLEQSIKLALRTYVFEPNDANTWVTVKSMIVNFLTDKWKHGALAGSSPEDAFEVQIGLGNSMTAEDILEGKMLVSIKLAIVRPAEFMLVNFEQQMQKS